MKPCPYLPAAAALLVCTTVGAQTDRDPTRAPEVAAAVTPGGPAGAAPNAPYPLLVVDGRRYVLEGSRLRGVGDLLGSARIQNIEDAAVVVRDAGGIRRIPLHSGIVKRPARQARSATPNSR